MTLTATMGEAPYPVVGFPPGDNQTEWWEGWPWTGIATHAAGMHLSNLRAAEKMAVAVGDEAFAEQCRGWFQQGSDDLEKNNWRDGSYLLYNKPQTGDESDKIVSNQIDGQWANRFLGITEDSFQRDRIDQALETIRTTCFHTLVGAVSFASRNGPTSPTKLFSATSSNRGWIRQILRTFVDEVFSLERNELVSYSMADNNALDIMIASWAFERLPKKDQSPAAWMGAGRHD